MYFDDDAEREQRLLGNPTNEDNDWDPDPSGYYAALGVSQSASQSAVRKAFLHLSQSYHTDKHSGSSEEIHQLMNERFQKLQGAYAVLSDEKQRAAYDASGEKGIDRLALVPQSVNRPEDIVRYLSTLEREAELLKVSKMLSAGSTVELSYSIAHLFISRLELQRHLQGGQHGQYQHDGEGETEELTGFVEESHDQEAQDQSEAAGKPPGNIEKDENDSQTETTGETNDEGGAQRVVMNANFSPKEVILDGRRQIVLVPSEDVQVQMRQLMGGNRNVASGGGRAEINKERPVSYLTLVRTLMLAVVPKSVFFRHSFQHQITPTLNMLVIADTNQRGTQSDIGCVGLVEYQPDGINSHKVSCRTSVGGLRINYTRSRVLNPLWTLRAKLTCLKGFTILEKYEIGLTRKISRFWELENALVMSISEHGMFRSAFSRALTTGVQQGISTQLGYHTMNISLYDVRPVVYGDDTKMVSGSADGHTSMGGPRGYLRQSLVMMPFSGKTELSFQAWCQVSKWYSIGIGFGTVLPYSLSPVVPLSFFVSSRESVCVNQFSLLYARGSHTIRIPVIAFISPRVQNGLLWLAAPVALYRVAQHIWRPYARMRTASLCQKLRLEHQAEMDIARARALQEQRAIESFSLQNRTMEERVGGLVILNAKYGVLQPRYSYRRRRDSQTATVGERVRSLFSVLSWWRRSDSRAPVANETSPRGTGTERGAVLRNGEGEGAGGDAGLVLDVTVPLQNFVQDSRLVLPEGSKSKLVGFTDPDPFTPEQKHLKIVYWFRRRRHMVVINENDPVELPLREHLVDT